MQLRCKFIIGIILFSLGILWFLTTGFSALYLSSCGTKYDAVILFVRVSGTRSISYEYTFNNKIYKNSNYRVFSIGDYQAGDKINIFLDEKKPSRSIICSISIQVMIENFALGGMLLAIVIYVLILAIKKNLLWSLKKPES